MNNDLISREALKKALEEDMKYGGVKTDEFDKGYDLGIKTAIEMLDNAPTVIDHSKELVKKSVELGRNVGYFEGKIENEGPQGEYTEEDIKQAIKENFDLGYEMAKNKYERPQGEWTVTSNGTTNYYVCNQCGNAGDIQDKFCRHCGADMRGAV